MKANHASRFSTINLPILTCNTLKKIHIKFVLCKQIHKEIDTIDFINVFNRVCTKYGQ